MESGTVLKWLVADGEPVAAGEDLVEIETDKATMTYAAESDGFLAIVEPEGATLPIGTTIAQLLSQPGEQRSDGPTADSDGDADPSSSARQGPSSTLRSSSGAEPVAASSPRVNASPLARRLAAERGIDLAGVTGSGRDGRIMREDVEAVTTEDDLAHAKGIVEVVELTRTQALIARRMAESNATIPAFAVTVEVDAEAVFSLRDQTADSARSRPSVNDFVIKAAALALDQHPLANGSYRAGHVELYSRINVGIAVAANRSLVVPTIFDADQKSVVQIAAEARELAKRVRDEIVTPPELSGGTFTVSNLGMFGVTRFTAVINPPQAAILAVGAAVPRFVPDEHGQPRVRRLMELTLVADHRVLYGSDAAAFLETVRNLLEQPAALTA
jgi:pyruvate dehydrogenase E2 component (dihydrolipoamide acetyltransferase)